MIRDLLEYLFSSCRLPSGMVLIGEGSPRLVIGDTGTVGKFILDLLAVSRNGVPGGGW